MKTTTIIKGKTLSQILIDHQHWLNEDCDGWQDLKADLSFVNLRGVNLSFVNLNRANLCGADLSRADLNCANLSEADLHNVILTRADLSYVDLSRADLSGADLYGANLDKAKGSLIEFRKGKILTEDIIGYKKCKDDVIVTLKIPRGAIVFSINGTKCRTNKAKVIAIDGADRAISNYKYMSYYVGDEFNIYDFNCDYRDECAEGIHFFMSREEADRY